MCYFTRQRYIYVQCMNCGYARYNASCRMSRKHVLSRTPLYITLWQKCTTFVCMKTNHKRLETRRDESQTISVCLRTWLQKEECKIFIYYSEITIPSSTFSESDPSVSYLFYMSTNKHPRLKLSANNYTQKKLKDTEQSFETTLRENDKCGCLVERQNFERIV